MKKRLFTLLLTTCLLLVSGGKTIIYANSLDKEQLEMTVIQFQINEIMTKIDKAALLEAVENDVVDASVPQAIREGVNVAADFVPVAGISQDDIDVETHSTVQKVGEITQLSGKTSNMYVAVAEAEATQKEDSMFEWQNGVKAWAYVIWIDNFGIDNELVQAQAYWEPGDMQIENRLVEYGVCDVTSLLWIGEHSIARPTKNVVKYPCAGWFTGFKFKCHTEVDIINIGTLSCTCTSSWTA